MAPSQTLILSSVNGIWWSAELPASRLRTAKVSQWAATGYRSKHLGPAVELTASKKLRQEQKHCNAGSVARTQPFTAHCHCRTSRSTDRIEKQNLLTALSFPSEKSIGKSIRHEVQAATYESQRMGWKDLLEGRCGELAYGLWKLDPGARLHDHCGGKVHLGLQRSHLPATQLDLRRFHVYFRSAWHIMFAKFQAV